MKNKTEQITEKKSPENGDKNKDTEVNNDQEEGTLNKCDVLVGGASTDDNNMEGYSKNAEVENSEGKNKADVRY